MIKDRYRAGISVSEIARRTGHDRKTGRRNGEVPGLAAQLSTNSPSAPLTPLPSQSSQCACLPAPPAIGMLSDYYLASSPPP